MASKVYFTDMRTRHEECLQEKLLKLIRKAGFDTIDFKDHYAAIKLHFGELGNLAFLRPNWAKTVVDEIKKEGGKIATLSMSVQERTPSTILRRRLSMASALLLQEPM